MPVTSDVLNAVTLLFRFAKACASVGQRLSHARCCVYNISSGRDQVHEFGLDLETGLPSLLVMAVQLVSRTKGYDRQDAALYGGQP
jgi:hypothetical protein